MIYGKQEDGRRLVRSVVNISSSSGTLRRVGQSVYGMTKSALDYLTQTLAGELAPLGVRVNGISPGPIDTPIHATWADDLAEAYRWLGVAAEPAGLVHDRSGHPAGRRPGH